jgi:hypothetical protein
VVVSAASLRLIGHKSMIKCSSKAIYLSCLILNPKFNSEASLSIVYQGSCWYVSIFLTLSHVCVIHPVHNNCSICATMYLKMFQLNTRYSVIHWSFRTSELGSITTNRNTAENSTPMGRVPLQICLDNKRHGVLAGFITRGQSWPSWLGVRNCNRISFFFVERIM